MITRREFLKAGVGGSVLLNVAGCSRPSSEGGRERILAALIPVMLAGALPAGAEQAALVERTIAGVGKAIAGLSANMQAEIGELFDLLAFPPTRMLVAGIWSPWQTATTEDIAAFLERWRNSRFALLNSGYAALHDLVFGAWYARPDTWPAIGYPGPPRIR
jgi:hypothetical protein